MTHVLLLKKEKAGDPFLTVLEQQQYKGTCIAALSFQYKNLDELGDKLGRTDEYAGLILTSQNSVKACVEAQDHSHLHLCSQWRGKHNYVVGESTKLAAQTSLQLECRGSESGNAAALAEVVHSELSADNTLPFLYPKTSLKTIDVSSLLLERGFHVDEVEVYDTIADPEFDRHLQTYVNEISGCPLVYIVFFSPSGVNCCLEKVTLAFGARAKFIAIGPSTSLKLQEKGVEDHLTLAKPKPECLISCLLEN